MTLSSRENLVKELSFFILLNRAPRRSFKIHLIDLAYGLFGACVILRDNLARSRKYFLLAKA